MKRMNNPTLASKNEDLDRIVARAWPGSVAQTSPGLQAHRRRSPQACGRRSRCPTARKAAPAPG